MSQSRRQRDLRCSLVTTLLVLFYAGTAAAQQQVTFDQLRLIAPAAPGGGWDQTARVMQQALQRSGLVRSAPVENIAGAAGTIGLARFVGSEQGRADTLLVSGLIMLGGVVMHRSPVTLREVTPIARLTGEYEAIVVPANSPFRTLDDMIRALRARPESLSWGGGSAGGSDQILAGLVAEAVGVAPGRINYVAFSGGGESLSAILGGQVSVGINGLAELEPQIQAGTVRALAISSAERLPGLDVPTLREQGVEVEFENWRSVVAPPGIAAHERQRLESLIAAMVATPEWRAALERYRWLDRYLSGEAFARFADSEETRVRATLQQLDTGQRAGGVLASVGMYPTFVLAGLAICALAAVVFGRPTPVAMPQLPRTRFAGTALWIVLALVVNLLLAERAGFVVASTSMFWLTARAFDDRHPFRDALIAALLSLSAYILFGRLLQLPLPAGVVERWI
ncbi:MAG TPA: tripartite tricarboxylate transporter substrate-binding protein [Vicinamibacterales bacterium]|nr:tripartite tricarboxylate transporter substrate-binding protein [Vicinamibacterales bacterium]